ncbi:restriction endonuclease subunit S [Leifsonia sp. H3M29-4]|uniref:restriction endonuclease subunit S n=1 Tax=Salinibacterium metalliresistens TaxID=3031321 RepID=UPI0023DA0018|nr:restriction endonuclease subunit S [Salinibacterium metalliresistens]MDF1478796.1 restriction endonuclease subunit S [Salinibacterium metalliresistens]
MSATADAPRWRDTALLELVTIKSGQVDPRASPYRDLPLIAPDHIATGTGRLVKKESASTQGAISGKYFVRPGDVIYSKIRPYLQKAYRCDFEALCSADMYPLTPRGDVDSSFILHSLLGHDFTNFAVSVSARSGIPKINREELAEYRMRTPGGAEQRAIGKALDDADNLIAALERLIVKKQAIKQGMMQQLLTGTTRLPGFTASWRQATIGDLASVSGGGTPSTRDSSLWGGGIPWFTPAEIPESGAGVVTTSDRTITKAGLQKSAAKMLPEGTVLVTSRASIGHCAIAGRPVATNQGFTSLVPSDRRSTEFLYYWVQQHRSRFVSRAAGSTFLEISGSKVATIEILAPAADEQAAIGAVLSDADADLRGLQLRLTKARNVKQGMMQQLLTGRTRLPVEAAV